MDRIQSRWLIIVMLAGALLAACSAQPVSADPAPATDPGPRQVVESFYTWYLDYTATDPETGDFKNPLVDGAYQGREELAPEMVARVDTALAQAVRADPFLCAQDLPTHISVTKEEVASDEALISVESSFEGHAFKVKLVQIDGQWKISEVMCSR